MYILMHGMALDKQFEHEHYSTHIALKVATKLKLKKKVACKIGSNSCTVQVRHFKFAGTYGLHQPT